MPRLLAIGHVTWDDFQGRQVLGGSVSYASLTAKRLGWEAGVLTCAGPDFDPEGHLPGVEVFVRRTAQTTRFRNHYDEDGIRRQVLVSRSDDLDFEPLPDHWRNPDVLLLGPVAGELGPGAAPSFQAEAVGALAQGWLREVDDDGQVTPREWPDSAAALAGVHVLFLSENDLPETDRHVTELLRKVPIVAVTRGWRGVSLYTGTRWDEVPSLPRPEVDPTGAGDVFAAAFLVRYHETGDVLEAAAFGGCAASCAVEGIGASTLGDRSEVERRLVLRQRMIEEGEWQE